MYCRVVVPSTGIFEDLKVQVENRGNSQKIEGCWFDLSSFFLTLCLFLVFGPSAVYHGDRWWTIDFHFSSWRSDFFKGTITVWNWLTCRFMSIQSIPIIRKHPKTLDWLNKKAHTICMSRLGYFKTTDGCCTEKDKTVLLSCFPKIKSVLLTQHNAIHYTHKFNQGRLIPKWILDVIYTMFCHWSTAKDQDGGLWRLSNSFLGEDAHPNDIQHCRNHR